MYQLYFGFDISNVKIWRKIPEILEIDGWESEIGGGNFSRVINDISVQNDILAKLIGQSVKLQKMDDFCRFLGGYF